MNQELKPKLVQRKLVICDHVKECQLLCEHHDKHKKDNQCLIGYGRCVIGTKRKLTRCVKVKE